MNVDYIASRGRLLARQQDLISEQSARFEHGVERHVNDEEVDATLAQMGADSFEVFLGGSAFNTINAAAHLLSGLTFGYVGVAGNVGHTQRSFHQELRSLSVDTSLLGKSPHMAGRCISYISDGERSLLTTPGANNQIYTHLQSYKSKLLKYLSAAKIVHLTSLFDDKSPELLVEIVGAAKKKNPWLKVSFDPGHEWVKARKPWLFHMLALSDYVFLNNREFEELGHHRPGTPDTKIASNIIESCGSTTVLIVLKKYDSICIFYKLQGRLLRRRFENSVLGADVIEDATGAGDIFAAGFLTGLLIPGMEISHAVELGLTMARSKLLVEGYTCFPRFPAIFRNQIDKVCSEASSPKGTNDAEKGGEVFIAHGSSALWSVLSTHLEKKYHIKCIAYETESRANQNISTVLTSFLDRAAFAIIIITPDDEALSGARRARQNVVHEMGLFHGKLGFNKVAILLEESVEKPSNIDGLQYIGFCGNQIQKTFHEIEQSLRASFVIP